MHACMVHAEFLQKWVLINTVKLQLVVVLVLHGMKGEIAGEVLRSMGAAAATASNSGEIAGELPLV